MRPSRPYRHQVRSRYSLREGVTLPASFRRDAWLRCTPTLSGDGGDWGVFGGEGFESEGPGRCRRLRLWLWLWLWWRVLVRHARLTLVRCMPEAVVKGSYAVPPDAVPVVPPLPVGEGVRSANQPFTLPARMPRTK